MKKKQWLKFHFFDEEKVRLKRVVKVSQKKLFPEKNTIQNYYFYALKTRNRIFTIRFLMRCIFYLKSLTWFAKLTIHQTKCRKYQESKGPLLDL